MIKERKVIVMTNTRIISEYEQQALDFLEKVNATMKITYIETCKNNMWGDDRLWRRHRVTITRNHKRWTFSFYDSIVRKESPTPYDVLACIEKYDPGVNIEDFACEYGYDYEPWEDEQEARRIERIYNACLKEYENCCRIFGDALDELREIN